MAPSKQKLTEAFGDCGKDLRNIITGQRSPMTCPRTEEWVHSCYNPPNPRELQMNALDEIMVGFGVEAIRSGPSSDDKIIATYVNMGDTYNTTIVYNYDTDQFEITSWGDWVEWAEKKGLIKP